MNKQYKLDVRRITEIEGSFTLGYFSYGHHDKNEFAKSVKIDMEESSVSYDEVFLGTVRMWAKSVPWCGEKNTHIFSYSKVPRKYYSPITIYEM